MPNINGNPNANNITGTNQADFINAKGGNDTVNGGDGNDTIWGGDGHDFITGGAGADSLLGDNGADTLNGGDGNDIINGGAGIDTAAFDLAVTVNLGNGTATGQGVDTLLAIENVPGSNFADYITGSAGANLLVGNGGSDTFFGSGGYDTLDGGVGGNDAVDFANNGAATASLAAGNYSFAGGTGVMTGIEHLLGSGSGDNFTGDTGANKLDGRDGADTLAGGQGNDQLWGGAGSDRLVADGGNDYLSGNYSMFGGYGDSAADTFVIATNVGTVTIADFDRGIDKLDLSHFGFDQNGVSASWTGAAVQQGFDTVLTLNGPNSQSVTLLLQGVVEGHLLSTSDMIAGSASLIPAPPLYPVNGGNAQADVFVIMPQNGNVTIDHFENGLDLLDVSGFINNGWDGFLSNLPDDSAVLEFFNGSGGAFTVTLTGHHYALVDESDFIM